MLINLHSIIIDKPIPGLTGISFGRCTTLADVLAALATQAGADVRAVSGAYDPATENIVITLSNDSTFAIPASLLLPVVADGVTITGNGTNSNKLTGYKVDYDPATGALAITPPAGAAVTIPAQTATSENAVDVYNLLGLGAGATVTTQQLLDRIVNQLCRTIKQLSSAIVINPNTGIRSWTTGAVEQTPVTAVTVTNDTDCPMVIQLAIFHGLYVRNSVFETPKVQTISAESTLEVDNGSGVLTSLGSNPSYVGNNQLAAIAPASDPGQNNNAGIQVHTTNLLYLTLSVGSTATYRARATATVHDGGTGNIWTYTSLGMLGIA